MPDNLEFRDYRAIPTKSSLYRVGWRSRGSWIFLFFYQTLFHKAQLGFCLRSGRQRLGTATDLPFDTQSQRMPLTGHGRYYVFCIPKSPLLVQ